MAAPSLNGMTLWQRLNTTLLMLLFLLIAGMLLTFWMADARAKAEHRYDTLDSLKDRIRVDAVVLTDALRGLLLDPKADPDKKRRRDAVLSDLMANLDTIPKEFPEYNGLVNAASSLRDFSEGSLRDFEDRVIELAQVEPDGAATYYATNQPALSKQRDQLFGTLALEIDRARSSESQRAQKNATIALVGVVLLAMVSLIVGLRQSSAVTEPLGRLVGTLDKMRQGDFTERLNMPRRDEFGVLAGGLNRLADDLSELVGQVQRSGIQVNTTATQIAASAKEQQSTAHAIAATTAQIGATSKQISTTSKDLVKTMNEVNSVVEETTHLAGSGQAAISRMESTIRQIVEVSGAVTAKLSVLSERTSNINSVVTTITKVADQTNLLSLNAAIEAEKAGEYGLGFAVVAMEIRRLADQTAVATYDIEKMVKEMQSAVTAGVMGMDRFSEEVRRGVEEVRQVSSHLAQIIHQVQTLTPRFQSVNEGMHAQASGAQQISDTLTQLSEAAHQTAGSLRESNAAIEQLNGAARSLQTSVARFKLGT